MPYDILVVIDNYVATDTYEVELYKEGSVIPAVTKTVAAGAGPNVQFLDLAEAKYNVKVCHWCGKERVCSDLKPIGLNAPDVGCPVPVLSDFIRNADGSAAITVSGGNANVTGVQITVSRTVTGGHVEPGDTVGDTEYQELVNSYFVAAPIPTPVPLAAFGVQDGEPYNIRARFQCKTSGTNSTGGVTEYYYGAYCAMYEVQ